VVVKRVGVHDWFFGRCLVVVVVMMRLTHAAQRVGKAYCHPHDNYDEVDSENSFPFLLLHHQVVFLTKKATQVDLAQLSLSQWLLLTSQSNIFMISLLLLLLLLLMSVCLFGRSINKNTKKKTEKRKKEGEQKEKDN
jgi:hypothetical protein